MVSQMSDSLPVISVDQLVIGLYVHLDLRWTDHPFTFNNFKLKSPDQIDTIRSLGLENVRYDPAKSDVPPGPVPTTPQPVPPPPPQQSPQQAAKLARMERLSKQREAIAATEREFMSAAGSIKNITRNLFSRPAEAMEEANALVTQMVESLLTDRDVAIHLMNDKVAGEEVYYHSLNVAVLAMILGKESGRTPDEIKTIGVGSLFHDIGKLEIPERILMKTEPLTKAEADFMRQHCAYGLTITKKLGLPTEVLAVIAQHHEAMDGSGYPTGCKGDKITRAAQVVAIVNAYDNLCNPINLNQAVTPHEALSLLFAQQRARYESHALNTFIRCLGVFPPGTVVRLSNDMLGIVMSVNSSKPLKPAVLVYDPDIPKNEAIIVDLENESDLNIAKAIRPGQLPRPVYEYLSPRKRVTYYFDAPGQAGKPA